MVQDLAEWSRKQEQAARGKLPFLSQVFGLDLPRISLGPELAPSPQMAESQRRYRDHCASYRLASVVDLPIRGLIARPMTWRAFQAFSFLAVGELLACVDDIYSNSTVGDQVLQPSQGACTGMKSSCQIFPWLCESECVIGFTTAQMWMMADRAAGRYGVRRSSTSR
jgi:hypothetical protein